MEKIELLYRAAVAMRAALDVVPNHYFPVAYRDVLTELRTALGNPSFVADEIVSEDAHNFIFSRNRLRAVQLLRLQYASFDLARAVKEIDDYTILVAGRIVAEEFFW